MQMQRPYSIEKIIKTDDVMKAAWDAAIEAIDNDRCPHCAILDAWSDIEEENRKFLTGLQSAEGTEALCADLPNDVERHKFLLKISMAEAQIRGMIRGADAMGVVLKAFYGQMLGVRNEDSRVVFERLRDGASLTSRRPEALREAGVDLRPEAPADHDGETFKIQYPLDGSGQQLLVYNETRDQQLLVDLESPEGEDLLCWFPVEPTDQPVVYVEGIVEDDMLKVYGMSNHRPDW